MSHPDRKLALEITTVPESDNKPLERTGRKKGSGADGGNDGAEDDDETNQAEIEKVTVIHELISTMFKKFIH